jgi:hypothetical protein
MVKSKPIPEHTLRNMIVVALITSLTTGIMSVVGALILGMRLHEYKIEVDSQLSKLLALNKVAATAQGEAQGARDERNYQNDQERKDLTNDATVRAIEQPTPRGKGKR